MDAANRSERELLVIVDTPDLLPEAHLQTCEWMAYFVPSVSAKRGAACSGYISDLREVRDRFPDVTFCECMDDVERHGVAYAIDIEETLTEGLEYFETLTSDGVSVDVHYQPEQEDFIFTIDGRIGSRLSFDAIRDEAARPEIFAERAARAVRAIRWAEQDWRCRSTHRSS
ncbi:hypothetical protein [Actinoallomurus sp. NPDC052274]|uniref:hypothetical protein n=1 Tax=Actinoallomurus sp. NPDC052274 TaxID=3155420 RepID=UPI003430D41C